MMDKADGVTSIGRYLMAKGRVLYDIRHFKAILKNREYFLLSISFFSPLWHRKLGSGVFLPAATRFLIHNLEVYMHSGVNIKYRGDEYALLRPMPRHRSEDPGLYGVDIAASEAH
jgi:hypothetical protein